MATVTQLSFKISSAYDGGAVDRARASIAALNRDLDQLSNKSVKVTVNVDNSALTRVKTQLDEFARMHATATANVNTNTAALTAARTNLERFGSTHVAATANVNANTHALDLARANVDAFGRIHATATANINTNTGNLAAARAALAVFGATHSTATADVNVDRAHLHLTNLTHDSGTAGSAIGDMTRLAAAAGPVVGGVGSAAGGAASGLGGMASAAGGAGGGLSGLASAGGGASSSMGSVAIAVLAVSAAMAAFVALAPIAAASVALIPVAFIGVAAILIEKNKQLKKSFKEAFQDTIATILPLAKPVMDALVKSLQQVSQWVKLIGPAIKDAFSAAAPLVQPLLNIIEKLIGGALPGFTLAMQGMRPLLDGLGQGALKLGGYLGQAANVLARIPGLGQAMNGIMGALGQVVLQLAKAIAQVVATDHGQLMIQTLQLISVTIKVLIPILQLNGFVWLGLVVILRGVVDILIGVEVAFKAFFQLLIGQGPIVSAFATAWKATWEGMKVASIAIWNAMVVAWRATVTGLTAAWNAVSSALKAAWNATWNAMKVAGQAIWSAMIVAWRATASGFATAWSAVASGLTTAWNATWNAMKVAGLAIWNAMVVAWRATATGFATAWTAVAAGLSAAWNATWNAMKVAAQAIWTAMKVGWDALAAAFRATMSVLNAAMTVTWNAMWTAIRTVANAAWAALKVSWDAFSTAFRATMNVLNAAMRVTWQALWTAIRDVANAAWTALKASWNAFKDAFVAIGNALKTAFTAVWNAMWSGIRNIAVAAWDALKASMHAFATAFEAATKALMTALVAAWKAGAAAIGAAWNVIKKLVRDPIQAVVTVVYNNGIVKLWDLVAGVFGAPKLNPFTLPAFATGGPVRGTGGPTSDNVLARLSPGEHVLTAAEVNAAGGHSAIMNMRANIMGSGYKPEAHGDRQGGFALGGFLSGIGHDIVGAFKGAVDFGKVAFDAATGFAGGAIAGLAKLALGSIAGPINGLIQKAADAAKTVVRNIIPGTPGLETLIAGGGGPPKIVTTPGANPANAPGAAQGGLGASSGNGGGIIQMMADAVKNWITSHDVAPTGGGNTADAQKWADAQVGKPYSLGSFGSSFDCSSYMSGIASIILGKKPGPMFTTFAFTGAKAGPATFEKDLKAPFMVGVENRGIGHMAGTLNGKNYEATPPRVRSGPGARGAADSFFDMHYGMKSSVGGGQGVIPSGQHLAIIDAALKAAGVPPPGTMAQWEAGMNTLITRESAWNSSAVNHTDSNAAAGHPSQGLAQVIPSTFSAFHVAGTSGNILDPVANVAAAIRYIVSRYGNITNVQQANASLPPKGYSMGTDNAISGWHQVGEHGPEWVRFRGGEQVLPHGRRPDGDGGDHIEFHEGAFQFDLRGATKEAIAHAEGPMADKLRMAIMAGVGNRRH